MRIPYFTPIFLLALTFHFAACNNSTLDEAEELLQSDTVAMDQTNEKIMMPNAVEFASHDGLLISGVLWEIDSTSPIILLCHQSGSNYHEYDEIAPQLNELGFNCLAIDQRAGGILFDLVNITADRAISEGKEVGFLDAQQDINASINYCYERFNSPVILWGSSYSAGLALHFAQENEKVSAVIAFSPGDYFDDRLRPLTETMIHFTKPYFITSAKHEAKVISSFLEKAIPDPLHMHYTPKNDGKHGSKALWKETENNAEYWDELTLFLNRIKEQKITNP